MGKRLSLNEQVALFRGWKRTKKDKSGRRWWIDPKYKTRNNIVYLYYDKDIELAFELVKDMSRDFISLSQDDHFNWIVYFYVHSIVKKKTILFKEAEYADTIPKAICKAYIIWKKSKK